MPHSLELLEGSPPYMHTRYLTEAEQNQCLQNPTYSARLSAIKALREDVQYAQIALDVRRRTKRASKRQPADQEHRLQLLEDRFTAEDNILAELAEVLVTCPIFWHTEAVRLVDGGWIWPLPKLEALVRVDRMLSLPERKIPRHETRDAACVRQPRPTSAQRLSQRLSRGLSRLLGGRGEGDVSRLTKVRSE